MTVKGTDPLQCLPAEIVLRIVEFCPVPTIASLIRTGKNWNAFIDVTHQDTIFSSPTKTSRPAGARDLSFLAESRTFFKYFESTTSWKDLCRKQTLLSRNWNRNQPVTHESVYQVGNDAVWRFRADFKRRLLLSTSQQGGLNVTDMDCGRLLWRLSSDDVRPLAHLEYQEGTAVWDREGDAIEVWKTDVEGQPRGTFCRVAVLAHDCQTVSFERSLRIQYMCRSMLTTEQRGFQLSYNTLCVVSTEGQGFVYDMTTEQPQLSSHFKIEVEAVGHLDQDESVVVYSLGRKGYYFHDKASGALLGCLYPQSCKDWYHVNRPNGSRHTSASTLGALSSLPSAHVYPPQQPSRDRLVPVAVNKGSLPANVHGEYTNLEDDEWGAAMLCGPAMVGISRAGRVLVCPDWRAALDAKDVDSHYSIIETDSNGSSFDLGGWLSFRDNRIMFEILDRVYVIALGTGSVVYASDTPGTRPSYSFVTSSAAHLAVPVSFMALFDDCIMSTHTVSLPTSRHVPSVHLDELKTDRFLICRR